MGAQLHLASIESMGRRLFAVVNQDDEDCPAATDSPKPTFACPFYRRDPLRYMDCIHLKLTRVRDVKQHIQRKHSVPAYCCPICHQRFNSAAQRDDHIRERKCIPQPRDSPESPDSAALDRLKSRFDRCLPPVDQWHTIWNILFPGQPKSTSPYLGSLIEESIDILRGFWQQEGGLIISSVLRRTERAEDNEFVSGLLLAVFDEMQVQLGQKYHDTSGPHRRLSFPVDEPQPFSGAGNAQQVDAMSTTPILQAPATPVFIWGNLNNRILTIPSETQDAGNSNSDLINLFPGDASFNHDYHNAGTAARTTPTASRPRAYDTSFFSLP
ncbi:hypothetical protein B0T16DRAFT_395454 [Cercophora newfieldiana]|uniref:C2H2-type domain-containing protein n=1 Tax=Cercophora newfieldiana TaxID=92897 RepID=A0AA39XUA4_9PEZI|nr:hypothetical protein B0T16DRAFT_395454 [Cercophora newfieldiana]